MKMATSINNKRHYKNMENNIKSSSKGCSNCLINARLIGIAIGYGKACYNGLTFSEFTF